MKQKIAILLLSTFLLTNPILAGDVFQGHAEFDDNYTSLDKEMYTGKMETLENRDIIEKSFVRYRKFLKIVSMQNFFGKSTQILIKK